MLDSAMCRTMKTQSSCKVFTLGRTHYNVPKDAVRNNNSQLAAMFQRLGHVQTQTEIKRGQGLPVLNHSFSHICLS